MRTMPDDASPYRLVTIGPIPADHPLFDTGPIVDLLAMYGPDAGRPAPEAGLYAGLMSDDWLAALAHPDSGPSGTDVAAFVAYVTEKCRGVPDDATIPIDLGTARAIADTLETYGLATPFVSVTSAYDQDED
jgi:hypothetical protein